MARDWSPVVEILCAQLASSYVDPDVAGRVAARLRRRLAEGAYARVDDDEGFAAAVTRDTVEESGDQHLRLRHSVAPLPLLDTPVVPDSGRLPIEAALAGHGFARVERLPGNVGLVDIRRFFPARGSGHAAVAAMQLVADADVLLIDLRGCGGGEPDMVTLVESHLFDERTHVNDLYFPAEDRTIQWWTDPYVPGPVFGGTKPVFVLLGGASYSAAEGFAYDLQQLGRAVLVGEPTATGVAYFDFRYRVGDHLMFSVPSGYVRHPVTGRNWAPDGVQPDIRVGAARAFDTAYALALEHVLGLGADGYRRPVADAARRALAALRERAPDDADEPAAGP